MLLFISTKNVLSLLYLAVYNLRHWYKYLCRLMTKPTKRHMRPAKTQTSLGIRPVWSESSLSAWRKFRSLAIHWVHSEDSDQTGRMPRLIWGFAGHTCHFVGFVMRRLISCHISWNSHRFPTKLLNDHAVFRTSQAKETGFLIFSFGTRFQPFDKKS